MHFFDKLKSKFKKNKQDNFYKSSTTKRAITSDCTLQLSAKTELKKKQINEKLKVFIKKYMNSPEKLIQYLKMNGYKVYKIKNANKILSRINEEEGFILPAFGIKAVILNLIIGIHTKERAKFSLKTKEMFIFESGNTEIYTIAKAIHKYQGFKNNLPGFDNTSQKIFKKIKNNKSNTSLMIDKCSIKDIYACREALARDLESVQFSLNLAVEYERAKNALKKIKETNSANI